MAGIDLTQRYRDLVEELGGELGFRKGWKAAVAAQLGISPSFLSKVLAGSREVSVATARDAAARLRMDFGWFEHKTGGHRRMVQRRAVFGEASEEFIQLVDRAKKMHIARLNGEYVPETWILDVPAKLRNVEFVRLAIDEPSVDASRHFRVALRVVELLADLPLFRSKELGQFFASPDGPDEDNEREEEEET